jgi:hypothetical protein
LKVLLMQDFQTAASVLKHRLPHSAKPPPRILPQRGINMKNYKEYHNYDCHPVTRIQGFEREAFEGAGAIIAELRNSVARTFRDRAANEAVILSFDLYPGVTKKTFLEMAAQLGADQIIDVEEAALDEDARMKSFREFITDDRVFGVMCHRKIDSLYDPQKLRKLQERIAAARREKSTRLIVLVGFGTELAAHADIHVLCEITRWEIQLRYRSGMGNWNCSDTDVPQLTKYKIGFFIEWRIADRYKKQFFHDLDYCIGCDDETHLVMISGNAFRGGLRQMAKKPFRLEPYFDPGVWGGHWMQNTFDIRKDEKNLAWCFDGVPEENAINLAFGDTVIKLPAMDLTLFVPRELLGDRVHGRYGAEYPIRFDFLDTIGGGNLSLQVHPLTEYIQDEFGMHYTQDESYYILDTDDELKDTYVYLGVKNGTDKEAMARDLRRAEKGEMEFPAEKYVNKVPVKKHDHVLIPAGTIHCSGKGCMVLEISATPYIFTFKLWDWGRKGLDGLPRPIHVEHGLKNIQWYRDTDFVYRELVHQERTLPGKHSEDRAIETGAADAGREEPLIERTGLHAREPIEVLRYTLHGAAEADGDDSVVQGNLVEGRSMRIESPDGGFAPFTVHYAETFIVPAAAGKFRMVPEDDETVCRVVLASIRK